MPDRIECPHCFAGFAVPVKFAGKAVRCPTCRDVVNVPKAAALKAKPKPKRPRPKPAAPPPRIRGTSMRRDLMDGALKGFRGEYQPEPPTLGYRFAIAVVAGALLLLPMLYCSLIAGLGVGLYFHAAINRSWADRSAGGALAYLLILLAGAFALVVLLKPLLAPRGFRTRMTELDPDDYRLLYAFVDRLADELGAPQPARICVMHAPNASASCGNLWELLTGRMTLTIGLPLVSGLSLTQLTGIMGHELAHFRQGAGRLLTHLVLTISSWLARSVYERDLLDDLFDEAMYSRTPLFQFFGLLGWLASLMGRCVMWVFLAVGTAISAALLREMEYDADRAEASLVGSEGFVQSTVRLNELGLASFFAWNWLYHMQYADHLPNSIPHFISGIADRMPPDMKRELKWSISEKRTGWFDSHPATKDRIRAARELEREPIFVSKMRASDVFHEFGKYSKSTTYRLYKRLFGTFNKSRMRPIREILKDVEPEMS